MYLAIRYALFAVVATVTNILAQDVADRLYYGPYGICFSMVCGTLAGLVVKYALDKKYIFFYRTKGFLDDSLKFFLYSIMGVVTTCLFWGVELGFDFAFNTKPMRYLGAVIGLALGYWIKYRLDKRFVFTERV